MESIAHIDKVRIGRNFSKCAGSYDRYANVQRLAARRLIGLTPDAGVKNILEIGCGTANYTILVKEKFKKARIKTIDISEEMVRVARLKAETSGVEFVIADAEEMELPDRFDLITSNASFQWFEDLGASLRRYNEVLSEGGCIVFSVFGPLTFRELGKVLKEVTCCGAVIDSGNFLDKKELEALLKRYFMKSMVKELIVKEMYPSLIDLLNKIKHTGARGSGSGNVFLWKRDMLKRADEIYKAMFGKIEATYQLYFCKGFK